MNERKDPEVRKIQLTGGSTYTVSLPKKWVKELDLGAGDEMIIEEQKSSLLLSPAGLDEEESSETEIEVSAEESCDAIKRKILSLYLVGYNVIKIRSSDQRLKARRRNAIKELVRKKLVGTEIISESIDEIILQTLLSYSQLSAKDALRRMHRVASSMQENAITSLEENDKELAKEVIELDDEVDRFQMYLIREIKAAFQDPTLVEEIGLRTLRECLGYRLVSKHVERVGDHAASIAKNVLEIGGPVKQGLIDEITDMSSRAESFFDKSVDSLFKDDYEAAENVIQDMDELYDLEEGFNRTLSKEEPAEAMRIRLIAESIRRISEYGRNIAEVVLNLTVTEER